MLFFCVFLLIDFFLNFIHQYWINYELDFIICFGLLSIRLSWSHDLGCGFYWLTCVEFFLIECFFFISPVNI